MLTVYLTCSRGRLEYYAEDECIVRTRHLAEVGMVGNLRRLFLLMDSSDDEPMVILDAQDDWRFAKNVRVLYDHQCLLLLMTTVLQPLVIGPPHLRFYAGCPLRTHDGFNIGT